MISLLRFSIFTLFFSLCISVPLKERKILEIENDDLIDDDVVIDENAKRFGHHNESRVWDNKTIPYIIDNSLEHKSDLIKSAMSHISNKTCIIFTERTNEENYVRFHLGNGYDLIIVSY
ncbi:Astacin-like metalloprotease toxin [Leptotrombidium deliense]|uniref:Astacin-like metalloprotease toxin n=1 Tax=Leptotrombidium deliense TaxID=299467 RepID=A0A443RU84_9ACAR|nr:Astacin-like metalloprotease toxin [Leptotrombidium deliense]